jgi:chloramphenicol 3-O phosphotransferase
LNERSTSRPPLILVNGPSSAGKTTLCRALQQKILDPYLVVGFDDFIFMTASRYYRGADGARQEQRDADSDWNIRAAAYCADCRALGRGSFVAGP